VVKRNFHVIIAIVILSILPPIISTCAGKGTAGDGLSRGRALSPATRAPHSLHRVAYALAG
jgi:hypothetical protein